jgi:hypothetical protein
MFITPWFGSDRDGEIAHGAKLMVAMTAPNVPMTDRRLSVVVHRVTSESFIFSPSVGIVAGQRELVSMVLRI